jgi:hypothetical protein
MGNSHKNLLVWNQLLNWNQTLMLSSFRGEDLFKISSPLFFIFSLAAILVGSRDHRTQIWKGAIQGPFHQSLVAIGPVVSEEKSSCLEPVAQLEPNFDKIVIGRSSSKIVSGGPTL